MKASFIRIAAFLLAAASLACSLSACVKEDENMDDISTDSIAINDPETEEFVEETEPEPKTYITIDAQGAASYTVVRSDKIANNTTDLALFTAFRKELNARVGGTFSVGSDFLMPEQSADGKREILVGNTSRELSLELKAKLDALDKHGFGIKVGDGKIAVDGTTMYMLYKGLDYLMETYITSDESGKTALVIEDDLELIVECEDGFISPEEVMASGREMAFYTVEKLADIPTYFGCDVQQGGGSDGKYAYYAMINKSTTPETGMIYKYDMSTWELVSKSSPMPSGHTNDITYDSKNHRLVISYCSADDGYKGLVFVNPDTLEFIEYIVCPTSNRGVCYLPSTNQYLFATGYTFHLTDENFNTIKSTTDGYAELTTQGFYCDGKYIYDPRWKSGARYQTITINTLDGKFIAAVPFYNVDGEPENIFRDGNSFVMGCNKSDAVFRLMLLYKNWWE